MAITPISKQQRSRITYLSMSKSCINWFFCLRSKAFNLNLSRISSLHKGEFLGIYRHYTFEREPPHTILFFVQHIHSWASASRSMPPASAFWLPVSQSGTRAFRYRTGSPYSGDGLVPASGFLFIPVPDWLDAGQSDISAFKKSVVVVGGERDPVHVQTAGSARL